MESLGKRNEVCKLFRNFALVRDERVAGAKTCDDTLSSVSEGLLCRKVPTVRQPSRYRDGYDKNGKIL